MVLLADNLEEGLYWPGHPRSPLMENPALTVLSATTLLCPPAPTMIMSVIDYIPLSRPSDSWVVVRPGASIDLLGCVMVM